ncbi:hypothetical protein M3Y97_00476900 [Aphelenchoides bicaudatus]|nr:hypothetical protein M3Y97_00476900 [Aphelenchoides bicaudatus]
MDATNNLTTFNCPSTEHRFLLAVYIVIVTFLNVLLLYFIRYKTTQNMQTYKIVLYSTTIIDFFSAWSQALIGIRISLQGDMQTYNLDGILPALIGNWEIFSGGRLHFLAMLETFFAAFSLSFGPVAFVYRYFAVCREYKLSPTQFFSIVAFLGFCTLFSAGSYAYMSNMFYDENVLIIPMDPQCLRSLSSWTARQSVRNTDGTPHGTVEYWLLRGWFYSLSTILGSYFIIFLLGWRIQVALKQQTALFETKKAKEIQKQLNWTIWMQALIPFFTCGIALLFYYYAIRTNTFKLEAFTLQFYSFMVFPIINPCISIFFISAYRRSYIAFWQWLFGLNRVHDDSKVNPTQNRITGST